MSELSHINEKGEATMVDVGEKAATSRTAIAEGYVFMAAGTLALIEVGRGAQRRRARHRPHRRHHGGQEDA